MSKAILFDVTMCIGCGACRDACKEKNGFPEGEEEELSSTAYTVVQEKEDLFVRRMCMHCVEPTCVSVCPVGAFEKTPEGPVTYDADKCIGCRYCMLACPFQVPRYEWDKALPLVRKCDMCGDRVAQGLPAMCAEVCPTGATMFGDRDELIEEAERRIRQSPETYVHHIYGVEEVGGTSVLILSPVPFEELGYRKDLGKNPLPLLTWKALSKIPSVVAVGGVALYGIWWITNRRVEVAEYEKKLKEQNEEG